MVLKLTSLIDVTKPAHALANNRIVNLKSNIDLLEAVENGIAQHARTQSSYIWLT